MSAEGGQLDEEIHIFARLTRHANRVDHERITIEGDVERMQTLLVLMVGVKSPKTEKSIINIDYFQSNDAGRRTSSAPSPTAKTPATRAEQTHGPGKQI